MKFSESWLREWVNPQITSDELCEQITMLGLEVDDVSEPAAKFSGVIVAEVVSAEQHPDADKLRVTKVNIGQEQLLDIVCGAANCRAGLKVACAVVGAVLPGDFKIKAAKLRGMPSEGMLCSYQELGITIESDGIIELPADAPIGTDLVEYLNLNDKVIEIGLTPNRADCLSIQGIAREVAVVNNLTLNLPFVANPVKPTISDKVAIELVEPAMCPRYLGRVIKNINLAASSPIWMQEKLRRCGMRSIDPIVDVTNYVLLELGQPMHAFDLAKICQPIVVRSAKPQEPLTLLDGNQIELAANTLVIADSKSALAIAGVFGGQDSGVNDQTKDIILESAFFAPDAIINKARQYGLHTESSHRFERGVNYQLQYLAMERATELLLAICGGEAGEICEAVSPSHLPQPTTVQMRKSKLDRLLGHIIPEEKVTEILTNLGLQPSYENTVWTINVPAWRFDLSIEEDVIEEVVRVYGFNNVPNLAPLAHLTMAGHREAQLDLVRIKTALVDRDYQEAVTYSFVDPEIQTILFPNQEALILPNPISVEMSAMRVSLLTGLLDAVVYNQNRQQTRIRLFETGLRFIIDKEHELGVRQETMLAGIISGANIKQTWLGAERDVDFFDLKGDLEAILDLTDLREQIKFIPKTYSALHPGQSAAIMLNGEEIGFIGLIHPKISQKLNLSLKTVAFEIEWDKISSKPVPKIQPVSRFPANRRDISIVVAEDIMASDIIDTCKSAAKDKITEVNLFDVYQGKGVEEGCKSIAISLIIQDTAKTLTEDDINLVITNVLSELQKHYNAYLRE